MIMLDFPVQFYNSQVFPQQLLSKFLNRFTDFKTKISTNLSEMKMKPFWTIFMIYYDTTKPTNPHKKVWNDVDSYYFENKS